MGSGRGGEEGARDDFTQISVHLEAALPHFPGLSDSSKGGICDVPEQRQCTLTCHSAFSRGHRSWSSQGRAGRVVS